MRAEGKSGELGNLGGRALPKFRMRIQASPDGGAADGQIVETVERKLEALDIALQQAGPAAKLLPESERHGILQMGAANFYDVLELGRLGRDRVMNALDGGNQRVFYPIRGRDVHGSGERIVGRLRHVDVIIGMNWLLRSQRAARQFNGAVRNHLIDVHVGLGAAAGLPDAQGKLVVKFAGNHFVGGLRDEPGFVGRKLAQILIHQRAGFLEDAKGADHLRRHGVAANVEMKERALGLCAPVNVRRDLNLSHAVGFNASFRFRGHSHRPEYLLRMRATGDYSAGSFADAARGEMSFTSTGKPLTTKDTKYHEGLSLEAFLRVPSCPSWLMVWKLAHH